MFRMFDKSKKKYLKKIIRLNRFQDPYTEKSFKKIKRLKSLQKRRRVFRTHASIDFFANILNGFIFLQYELHHRSSTRLCLGLWKYWDFKSEAKVEQIIAIVTTHSVSCFPRNGFHDNIVDGNILVFYSFKLPFLLHIIFLFFIFYLFSFLFIYLFFLILFIFP